MSQPSHPGLNVACLFSTTKAWQASCLANETQVHDRTERGPCRFLPALISSEPTREELDGIIAIIEPDALTPAMVESLERRVRALHGVGIASDLVPLQSPLKFLVWMGANAGWMGSSCHMDGEVRIASPGWWRNRVETWLATSPESLTDAKTHSTTAFNLQPKRH